jgi:pseudouridine synthase
MSVDLSEIRIQKIVSAAGIASRRAAETLMLEGRVTVNGKVVSVLGARANPDTDVIRVDGRRVSRRVARRYLLLNKPRGVVTTRNDPQQRRTVMDLVRGVRESVYPVGRLDYDSEGLLLLTNDGALAAKLTHPRYGLEKVYEVRVRGVPDSVTLGRLTRGVSVDGRRFSGVTAVIVSARRELGGEQSLLRIGLTEGRNRQVRKMCAAIGHPVVRLRRVRIGPLQDKALTSGRFRDLTKREVLALRKAVEQTGFVQTARSSYSETR